MEPKTHECIICNKQFSSRQGFAGHIKFHYARHPLSPHLQKPPTPQTAEQAGQTSPLVHPQRPKRARMPVNYKEVSDDEEEEEEEEVISGPSRVQTQIPMSGYTCKPCKQTFGSISALSVHEANHSGKMRRLNDMAVANSLVFNCEVCDRIFETKRGLAKHRSSHVPRVATAVNSGSIDVPPMENPRIMIDLNEPAPVNEGDDEVPNPKQ